MWRELITNYSANCEFNPPAQLSEISALEEEIGTELPVELKELLRETNGISYNYGAGLVWSTERITSVNAEFRAYPDFKDLYMPFDSLLFFADKGNGDQFAFTVLNGEVRRNDVFEWNHEDDSRFWAASNLKQYLESALNGKFN